MMLILKLCMATSSNTHKSARARVVDAQLEIASVMAHLVAIEHFMPAELKDVVFEAGIRDMLGAGVTNGQVDAAAQNFAVWREQYENVMQAFTGDKAAKNLEKLARDIGGKMPGIGNEWDFMPQKFHRELQSGTIYEEAERIAGTAKEAVMNGGRMLQNLVSSVTNTGELELFGVNVPSTLVPGAGMTGITIKTTSGVCRQAAGMAVDLAGEAMHLEQRVIGLIGKTKATEAIAPVLVRHAGPMSTRGLAEKAGVSYNAAAAFLEKAEKVKLIRQDASASSADVSRMFLFSPAQELRKRCRIEPERRHSLSVVSDLLMQGQRQGSQQRTVASLPSDRTATQATQRSQRRIF
jgi:hypothetical protein